MEKLDIVINFWEDALSAHALGGATMQKAEDSEFFHEIQNLLEIAYSLQEQSELLFLDERSVLFRTEESKKERGALRTDGGTTDSLPIVEDRNGQLFFGHRVSGQVALHSAGLPVHVPGG